MYPISRQRGATGLGMGYDDFARDFLNVCEEHKRAGRARGFAFVFYDVHDDSVRAALKQEGGFRILNEAAGTELTLFYLRDDFAGELARAFNRRFMSALAVQHQIRPPCIVFFRVDNGTIDDVSIHHIDGDTDQAHLIVEQLRRYVKSAIQRWREEGDFSALNPIPILQFVGAMSKITRMQS